MLLDSNPSTISVYDTLCHSNLFASGHASTPLCSVLIRLRFQMRAELFSDCCAVALILCKQNELFMA